ncbi:MAG: HupE/UreJ family protein [Proteobacteria bacterium]|nr:HupE/UreJ family protein [Pseudomonadota bacterium]
MRNLTIFAATLLAATPALAHPGHVEVTGLMDVVMHPFGEYGHLLVLAVAGGLLAVMLKEPARRWYAKALSRKRRRD